MSATAILLSSRKNADCNTGATLVQSASNMTTQDLEQIRGIVRTEIKAETEPLKQGQARLEADVSGLREDVSLLKTDVSGLKQDQKSLLQGQLQLKTAIESVKAGQEDLKEHMKAGFMDLGVKIDRATRDNKRLIEELEEQVNVTNPHKN